MNQQESERASKKMISSGGGAGARGRGSSNPEGE